MTKVLFVSMSRMRKRELQERQSQLRRRRAGLEHRSLWFQAQRSARNKGREGQDLAGWLVAPCPLQQAAGQVGLGTEGELPGTPHATRAVGRCLRSTLFYVCLLPNTLAEEQIKTGSHFVCSVAARTEGLGQRGVGGTARGLSWWAQQGTHISLLCPGTGPTRHQCGRGAWTLQSFRPGF